MDDPRRYSEPAKETYLKRVTVYYTSQVTQHEYAIGYDKPKSIYIEEGFYNVITKDLKVIRHPREKISRVLEEYSEE